jgi:glucosyl-dolichyl phosphate glucuronosyltransferase
MTVPGEPLAGAPAGLPSLSAVICAYTLDRWDDIQRAVQSLQLQDPPPAEVILVSDHNDELLDRARATFPQVVCLPNTGTAGLSGARNTGVAAASGDVIAFLDDDAAAEPGWSAALLAPYADETVIGVGGFVVPDWRAPRPAWFPSEFLWVVGCSYTGQPTARARVRNPIGANMSFRRAVFTAAGGFDPMVGRIGKDAGGCEETEFAIRAARTGTGGHVLLEPTARCRHTVTPDRVTRRYFRRRCLAEGRSKALVSQLAGADSALETERGYVLRTIPVGVLSGLGRLLRGDVTGAATAFALVEGTMLTAASYAATRLRLARAAR